MANVAGFKFSTHAEIVNGFHGGDFVFVHHVHIELQRLDAGSRVEGHLALVRAEPFAARLPQIGKPEAIGGKRYRLRAEIVSPDGFVRLGNGLGVVQQFVPGGGRLVRIQAGGLVEIGVVIEPHHPAIDGNPVHVAVANDKLLGGLQPVHAGNFGPVLVQGLYLARTNDVCHKTRGPDIADIGRASRGQRGRQLGGHVRRGNDTRSHLDVRELLIELGCDAFHVFGLGPTQIKPKFYRSFCPGRGLGQYRLGGRAHPSGCARVEHGRRCRASRPADEGSPSHFSLGPRLTLSLAHVGSSFPPRELLERTILSAPSSRYP